MITNIGKNLIGKYLVGQSTQYASHIAIGCGPKPINLSASYGDYSTKVNLDFEMERLPIISRGYISDRTVVGIYSIQVYNAIPDSINFITSSSVDGVLTTNQIITLKNVAVSVGGVSAATLNSTSYKITSANGTAISAEPVSTIAPTSNATVVVSGVTATGYLNKISLIAELPTDNRYEITELGLWSDVSNPIPSGIDSKNIFNFGRNNENWKYSSGGITSDIVYTTTALDNGNLSNNFDTPSMTTTKVVLTNSDNTFFNTTRITRQERPRFLDDCLILGANMSKFDTTSPYSLTTTDSHDYITLSNIKIGDLDSNSTSDEFILSYSLISKLASGTAAGTNNSVNIMIEFKTDINGVSATYLFRQLTSSTMDNNRYQTINVPLSAGTKSTGFLWKNVISANIYASVQNISGTSLTSDYCIALDGLNFNNKNNVNSSNYGLVAYVPIKNNLVATSSTGTIGTVSGTGPYTATISNLETSNFLIGSTITGTNGTGGGGGSFGSGVMTVTSVLSSTSIAVSSTATFTAGTVSSIIGIYPASSILKTTNDSRLVEFRLVLGTIGL